MNPAPRPSRRWPLVTVALIFAVVIGMLLGGRSGWMPGWMRDTFAPQSKAQQRFDQVLGIVQSEYYRPIDTLAFTDSALQAAIDSLDDPYSHYYPPEQQQEFQEDTEGQVTGIGVTVNPEHAGLQIVQVHPGSPAQGAGLQAGDLIVAVDGKSLVGVSSTTATGLITGTVGTTVRITYDRDGRQHTVPIVRATFSVPVASSEMLHEHGRKIGYVLFTQFTENSAAQLRTQVEKMLHEGAQGLILDLRDNPGGLLDQAVAAASLFIPAGTIVTTKGRSQPTETYSALGDAIAPSIRLAVLIDRGTASSAEIVTAALQQRRGAQVVGTRSYGKGVFQESQDTLGGGELDITVGQFFTPNGTSLGATSAAAGQTVARGEGVKPNVFVPDNPADPGPQAVAVAERLLAAEVK